MNELNGKKCLYNNRFDPAPLVQNIISWSPQRFLGFLDMSMFIDRHLSARRKYWCSYIFVHFTVLGIALRPCWSYWQMEMMRPAHLIIRWQKEDYAQYESMAHHLCHAQTNLVKGVCEFGRLRYGSIGVRVYSFASPRNILQFGDEKWFETMSKVVLILVCLIEVQADKLWVPQTCAVHVIAV